MTMFSSSLAFAGFASVALAQNDPDVAAVGDGPDVVFTVGDANMSLSEVPAGLRGYTAATVDALESGFDMGSALGDAMAQNRANEVELRANAALSTAGLLINAMSTTIAGLEQQLSTEQAATASTATAMQAASLSTAASLTGMLTAANQSVVREVAAIRSELGVSGLTAANPIHTCMAVKNKGQSGFYWVRPAGVSAAVKVWCDERWGGGWLQVFRKHPVVPPLCWTRAT